MPTLSEIRGYRRCIGSDTEGWEKYGKKTYVKKRGKCNACDKVVRLKMAKDSKWVLKAHYYYVKKGVRRVRPKESSLNNHPCIPGKCWLCLVTDVGEYPLCDGCRTNMHERISAERASKDHGRRY